MSNKNKSNNMIKQAGILAMAGIICRIIGILYRSPLTAIIGDEGNGYYSSAYNIYTIILLISSYSIPSAISKEIAQKLAVKEYKNSQRIFYCAIIYVSIIGGFASFFTFFCAKLLVEKNSVVVLKVFAPTIFLSGLLGVLRGFFQAHRTMLQTSISQIIEQIFNAIISIFVADLLIKSISNGSDTEHAIYGAVGSAIGTGTGVIISLLFMCFVYFINKDIIRSRIQWDSSDNIETYSKIIRNIFFTVTPIILSTFIYNLSTSLNQTIYTKISIYIKGFQEKDVATMYGIFAGKAVVIANIPIAIASSMSASLLPRIAETYIQGNVYETKRKIDTAIHTTLLISIPAAVGLAVLSKPVVQLLFPQNLSLLQASNLLRCLSITIVFYSLSTLTNAVLQGIGKANLPVINALFSLIIQTIVLVIIALNTGWNLYGLSIATIVYSLLMCILNNISVYKILCYKMNIKKNFIIPFIASVIMGIVLHFSYMALYATCKHNAISLFISIIVAAILYFLVLIKFGGLNKAELDILPKGSIMIKIAQKLHLF